MPKGEFEDLGCNSCEYFDV